MWGYYWAFTSAQIELILSDAPLVVYGKKKKGKFDRASASDVKDAAEKWNDKYKGKTGGVTLSLEGLKTLKSKKNG